MDELNTFLERILLSPFAKRLLWQIPAQTFMYLILTMATQFTLASLSLAADQAINKESSILGKEPKVLSGNGKLPFLEGYCESLAQIFEPLNQLHTVVEFLETAVEGLTAAGIAKLVKKEAQGEILGYIVSNFVTKIEISETQPTTKIVHYRHLDDNDNSAQLGRIQVRVFAEAEFTDQFNGCMKSLEIDVPKNGPIPNTEVTFDMNDLAKRFYMNVVDGIEPAKTGAPGGKFLGPLWHGFTNQQGLVQFILQSKDETSPSGKGNIQRESFSYTVWPNPYKASNVLASLANLFNFALIPAEGQLTAEWHDGSVSP